jgi:hypothetical protein
MHPKYVKK